MTTSRGPITIRRCPTTVSARPRPTTRSSGKIAEHKDWRASPTVTDDGKYLVLTLGKGTDAKYRVLYRPLDQPTQAPFIWWASSTPNTQFIDNDGPVFWFKTNKNAPRGKVVAIDTRSPHPEHWVEIDPRGGRDARERRRRGRPFPGRLPERRRTAWFASSMFTASTSATSTLPGLGTAAGFHGKRKDRETFYAFTSFTYPATIYRYEVASGESKLWRRPDLEIRSRRTMRRFRFSTPARMGPGSRCS